MKGERPRRRLLHDEGELVLVQLMRVSEQVLKAFNDFFRAHGLTAAQYNVLRILEGAEGPLPQQEIARRLLVSRANVTGLIDRLEARGLVERRACADRRVRMVHLTAQGLRFVEETFEAVTALCAVLLKRLSLEELQALRGLLLKLEGA
ncbi:MAG: hypothetical protein KatS3mg131_3415 [Candidatus Tectimicrobiota bacterium]|nr:MAG: hypothetical protein KatS3mg131_3415 [Candidatus Tectomicrobia bacterium]